MLECFSEHFLVLVVLVVFFHLDSQINQSKTSVHSITHFVDKHRKIVLSHDVIRDLALWIASECGKKKNRFLVRAGVGLTHTPEVQRWKEAERISLMNNEIKEVTETPQCPNLLTLLLQRNRYFRKFHTDFFQFMPLLRVLDLSDNSFLKELPAAIGNLAELRYLDLSRTWITSLPEEIGNLVKMQHLEFQHSYLEKLPAEIGNLAELRYLNLSGTKITSLPEEIGNLVKMQHFKFQYSNLQKLPAEIGNLAELRYLNLCHNASITSLPKEIGNLVKLKHLDLGYTDDLHIIPQGAISRLSELRVINLELSYSKWEEGSEGLKMSELEGLERLNHLNLGLTNVHALERLLCSSKLRNVTRSLDLMDLTVSNQLSSLVTEMKSLQQLGFWSCNGLVEVTISGYYPVSSLECLMLHCLDDLNCIRVGRGCFRNLHTIDIMACHKLKKIESLLQLESLEKIDINGCGELEEVISTVIPNDEVGDIGLMQLKHLSLEYLPELTSICSYALNFPSLEEIKVQYCPKLKKLPLSLHSAHNSLRKISGRKEWWDNLEWEEDGIKSYFLPFFHESNY